MPRPSTPGPAGARLSPGAPDGPTRRPPGITPYERFLLWERSSRDTIEVKRTYIDMAGDLVAGIVLSQIVYWHLPDRDGHSRLRVEREGKLWLAKGRTEWWDECRVTPKQVDRALETLRRRKAIETRLFKFNGSPTVHLRLDEEGFMDLWEAHAEGLRESRSSHEGSVFPQRGKTNFPDGENPSSPAGQIHLAKPDRSSTENTTENTAKTTTTAQDTEEHTQTEADDVVVALLRSLTASGVTKKRAERLIASHTPEQIQMQLAFLEYRKADDPAAVLVRSIEEEWAPPADYRKAQTEREKEERLRQRREKKAKEQAAATAAEEATRAAQDEWWNALGSDERDELSAQAEAALRDKNPFLFSNGTPKRSGVVYRTMFDAELRRLIDERMAGMRRSTGSTADAADRAGKV